MILRNIASLILGISLDAWYSYARHKINPSKNELSAHAAGNISSAVLARENQ